MDLNYKRVLITCGGGLGDMICFTPALRRLKEKYPQCSLTFMTKKGSHEIMQGLPYIDKVIYIRRGEFMGRYRVLPDFLRQDAVVFTDWQPQLLLASRLFGVPVRAGQGRPGHRLDRCLTYRLKNNVMASEDYAAATNARIFSEALGIDLDGAMEQLDVSVPGAEARAGADALLSSVGLEPEADFLLLSPCTGLRQRDWDPAAAAHFVELARERAGLPVIIIGAPDKRGECGTLGGRNLAGRTGTMELVELIRRSCCLVTPDSGPMHVAGALGTPCVALFSKDLPSRWAPRQNCRPIYLGLPCSPCSDDKARACPRNVACMQGITAEMAWEACAGLLGL